MTDVVSVLLVEPDERLLGERVEELLMDGYSVEGVSVVDAARDRLAEGPDALMVCSEAGRTRSGCYAGCAPGSSDARAGSCPVLLRAGGCCRVLAGSSPLAAVVGFAFDHGAATLCHGTVTVARKSSRVRPIAPRETR